MTRNIASRFALASALVVSAALPLNAQAPTAAAPTITFAQANNTIYSKAKASLVKIRVNVADVKGLSTASLSGAGRSSSGVFGGTNSATLELFWNPANAKVGSNITFTSTAVNSALKTTVATITVHVVD